MHMHSGKWVDVRCAEPKDIDLGDIAHAISGIIRWGGSANLAYTVEDHSLFCDELLLLGGMQECPEDPSTQAECHYDCPSRFTGRASMRMRLLVLLHDAHEAYLGDVRRPVANVLGITNMMARLKAHMDHVIYAALGVGFPTKEETAVIERIDLWSLRLEALWGMPDEVFTGPCAVPPITKNEVPACIGIEQHVRIHPRGFTWHQRVTFLLKEMRDDPTSGLPTRGAVPTCQG